MSIIAVDTLVLILNLSFARLSLAYYPPTFFSSLPKPGSIVRLGGPVRLSMHRDDLKPSAFRSRAGANHRSSS